mgnify:CR=1 FL=1
MNPGLCVGVKINGKRVIVNRPEGYPVDSQNDIFIIISSTDGSVFSHFFRIISFARAIPSHGKRDLNVPKGSKFDYN